MLAAAAVVMLLWIEGENFNYASEVVKPTRVDYAAASGGKAMYGPGVDSKGSVVRWSFTLERPMPEARLIFRYCRLHWRDSMVPAPFELKLSSGDWTKTQEIRFDNTGGWGSALEHWGLNTVEVGALPAGEIAMQITSLADNNSINLDGFFVAGPQFTVTAEELRSMARLDIDDVGYTGLALDSTTLSQSDDTALPVAVRSFVGGPAPVPTLKLESVMRAGFGMMEEIQPASSAQDAAYPRTIYQFPLGERPDMTYHLEITSKNPPRRVETDLLLVGQFTATLDERIEKLQAFVKDYDKVVAANAAAGAARADFIEAVAFLARGRDQLAGSIAETASAWRAHLATQEGVANAAPLAANLRKTLEQYETTARQLREGQAPYAERSGEMRRAWYSAATGELLTYRCFIPDAYASDESVPLILMLHGGGGNENTFHDMADGAVLRKLNEQGYFMLAPKYHRRNQPNALADLAELVDLTLRAYPKIDRRRIYCTGVSMGGFTTVSMASAYPDLFAAIAPVSGTGRLEMAEALKTTPTIIFQGGSDTVVPPAGAKAMARRLDDLGYVCELHLFEANGHDYKVEPYLTTSLEFFAKHRKPIED